MPDETTKPKRTRAKKDHQNENASENAAVRDDVSRTDIDPGLAAGTPGDGDESPKRVLTTHIVPGDAANSQLEIQVLDGPGPGNANHEYLVKFPEEEEGLDSVLISFQNGPIKDVGVNGVTNEALLAVLIDRMEGFQSGPFACHENQTTLEHLRIAMRYLHQRTAARIKRGVEGTHEK